MSKFGLDWVDDWRVIRIFIIYRPEVWTIFTIIALRVKTLKKWKKCTYLCKCQCQILFLRQIHLAVLQPFLHEHMLSSTNPIGTPHLRSAMFVKNACLLSMISVSLQRIDHKPAELLDSLVLNDPNFGWIGSKDLYKFSGLLTWSGSPSPFRLCYGLRRI